jgi:plasmid stability protein
MAQLLVRKVPDELVRRLKQRARQRGVSAEEEHRRILASGLNTPAKPSLAEFLLRNEVLPDVELDLSRCKDTGTRDTGL